MGGWPRPDFYHDYSKNSGNENLHRMVVERRYTRRELVHVFEKAGFSHSAFRRLPWCYFWLNRANYVLIGYCLSLNLAVGGIR
jgi:hypothetical protein